MRKIVINGLLVNALFSTACSAAAGGAANTTGLVFGVLGLLSWFEAFILDISWPD